MRNERFTARSTWLGILLLVAGCGTSARDEAVTFHAAVGEATQVVEAADLQFMVSLLPVLRGQPAEAGTVKTAHDGIRRAVEEARKRIAAATPPDSASARGLSSALTRFLERHEKAVAGDFAEAVKIVDDKALDAAARAARVRDIFVRLQDAEYEDFAALHKAQAEFAKEHHLLVREGKRDQPLAFLTALGVANGRLELMGKELGNALRPALGEHPAKGDQVARSLQGARDTLAAVRRIVDALHVPQGKAAKELEAAQKDYLKRQAEVFDQYFPDLLKLAHDPVLVPETRRERLEEVLRLMQVAEQAPLMRLTAAREDFLRENRLVKP